jgi:hypothetical protein
LCWWGGLFGWGGRGVLGWSSTTRDVVVCLWSTGGAFGGGRALWVCGGRLDSFVHRLPRPSPLASPSLSTAVSPRARRGVGAVGAVSWGDDTSPGVCVGELESGWCGGSVGCGDPDGGLGCVVRWGVVAVMVVFCEMCCGATVLLDARPDQRIMLQCNVNRNSVDGDYVSVCLRTVLPLYDRIPLRSNECRHIGACAGPCVVECGGVA